MSRISKAERLHGIVSKWLSEVGISPRVTYGNAIVNSDSGMCVDLFFFLMIRQPPRSTHSRSSAASDVYNGQLDTLKPIKFTYNYGMKRDEPLYYTGYPAVVYYTHLRANETVLDLVCRLLLEIQNRFFRYGRTHHF